MLCDKKKRRYQTVCSHRYSTSEYQDKHSTNARTYQRSHTSLLERFLLERKWRNRSRNDCWMLRHNTYPGRPPRALPKHEQIMDFYNNCVLVARGANTQLYMHYTCFAERLFKSSSISYLLCKRVASDSLNVGMPQATCGQQTEHYAVCVINRQNSQNNAILALNSIERTATFQPL